MVRFWSRKDELSYQLELMRSRQLGEVTFRGPDTWKAYGWDSAAANAVVVFAGVSSAASQFAINPLFFLFFLWLGLREGEMKVTKRVRKKKESVWGESFGNLVYGNTWNRILFVEFLKYFPFSLFELE